MHRALEGVDCWVSGVRRVDSKTRAGAPRFGWDERFDRWKLNPVVDWTDQQVWTHIKDNHVPYNPLHDQGYPSIGCMPCTSVPDASGDPRVGPLGRHGALGVRSEWVARRPAWPCG